MISEEEMSQLTDVLDRFQQYTYYSFMKRLALHKVIILSVIVLFLAEYLEPSTIGVRAGIILDPSHLSPADQNAKQATETCSFIPHVMIWMASPSGEKSLQESPLLFTLPSFSNQQFLKEIYHPPVLTS